MPVDPQVLTVVTAYSDRVAAIRQRVVAYVERVWGGLGSWDEADIERFVAAVVPVVSGGQLQTAALTDAYLAAVETAVLGTPARPVGVTPATVSEEALRGVPAVEVYRRPGVTVWTALKNGAEFTAAVQAGLRRATGLAATDLQLAKTHTARRVLSGKDNVVGHRRVLKGSKSCALCIVASTQRYRKADLQPCHPGCDCGVLPIYADRDPGQVIDPDRLDGVHQAIEQRFGVSDASGKRAVDYRKALVTHEHGEIGPVLSVRGQKFTEL
jgi:hypothetical protein